MDQTNNTQQQNSTKNEFIEWAKAITIAFVLAYLIRVFLFAPFIVEGLSMMPTLEDDERLIVNELIYDIKEPKRGDIIVFKYNAEQDYIKRVIGLPGDIVEMKKDQLIINGQPIDETYLKKVKEDLHDQGLLLTKKFGPVEVEENHLFVMGDNRRNSKDSRVFGTIALEQVVGRADITFWPISKFRLLGEKQSR